LAAVTYARRDQMTRQQQLLGHRFGLDSVIAARYEVGPLIGRGGMAEVYSAFDRTLGRSVALKVLHQGLAADHRAVARFRREARAVAALDHPNIVSIYDVGVDGETPFMVMELVDGEPLSTIVWRTGPLAFERAVGIAAEVAAALAFAHDRGIVHRDVKPGNVMVGPSGNVKVLDFGIARALHWTPLTEGGPIQGTAEYVSPEQVRGLALDGRSDIYSLGIVLYEMLAGHPPFRGDTAVAVAFRHLEEQPQPIRATRPRVPRAIEAIVMRCLAKKQRRRYQDAARLAEDLMAAADLCRPEAERPALPVTREVIPADTPLLPAPDATPSAGEVMPGRAERTKSRSRKRTVVLVVATLVAVAILGAGASLLLKGSPPARASTPPPPVLHGPTALAATGGCDGFFKGKVTLSWLASSSRFADGYVVYRGTSPDGPLQKVELLPGRTMTSYVDGGLNTSTTYYYAVRATAGSRISHSVARARAETPLICF
jgi:eukaryotic-like serine/threonine-protein kinase